MAGRREVPVDPGAGPVQRFAFELRKLRAEAGGLTYRAMAERAGYSDTTLSQAAAGGQLPTLAVTLAYVTACGGNAAEWEARWKQATDDAAGVEEDGEAADPPYRGLTRFETGDSGLFFGRDKLTADLLDLLRRQRFAAVFGASGCGKSSLLRAGLVPALQHAQDAGLRPAVIRILTPGDHPARTHAPLLDAGGSGNGAADRFVIVDQFEEVYTLCHDAAERARFIDLLLAARQPASGLRVLLAVRADFYGRCAEHRDLAASLLDANLLVGPMSPTELREAIVRPATAAGLTVERALTSRIVDETSDEPGGLPLMSHALLETWRRRRGRALTLTAYEATGGVRGALARTAEHLYTQLAPEQAALARRMLLRLITPGEGASDTRRPAPRAELVGDSAAEAGVVLDRLARARLVTLDDDTVDLAHEALITAWPRLRTWIEEDREFLRQHRRLTEAATAWRELGHDPGALYRGTRLASAAEAFTTPPAQAHLTALERAFLTASADARDHELATAARATRRLRLLVAGLSLLTVLALTAASIAYGQRQTAVASQQEALTAQREALSRQLATQSAALLDKDPDLASLLAVQAYRTSATREAATSLYAAARLPIRRTPVRDQRTGVPGSVAFSADGKALAVGDEQGTVRLWDTTTGRLRATLTGHDKSWLAVAFSADGKALAVGDEQGTVCLWDTTTGRLRATLTGHETPRPSVALSPDGRVLAVRSGEGTVWLWDTAARRLRTTLTVHRGFPQALAFSPDGTTVATGGVRSARLWDTATGRLRTTLTGHKRPVSAVAFSPDGKTLAVGADGSGIRLWEVATGRVLTAIDHRRSVASMAFSPDGRTLATATDLSTQLWNTGTGRLRTTFTGHDGMVMSVAFRPDGRTLATNASDGTTRLWDTDTERARTIPTGEKWGISSMAFSPDGKTLATGGDLSAQLWNTGTGRLRTTLDQWGVMCAAFSPDGRALATAAADGTVRLWDVTTGRPRMTLTGHKMTVRSVAFSADGKTLATGGNDHTVRLWDTSDGRLRATLTGQKKVVWSVAFSPDGKTLAAGTTNGTTRLWDIATGRLRTTLTGHKWVVSPVAFSLDGNTLAAASAEYNTVRLWDANTGRLRKTLTTLALAGQDRTGLAAAFSPDLEHAAVAENETLRVRDATTGAEIMSFPGHKTAITSVAFSPDSSAVATGTMDGTVRLWRIRLFDEDSAISKVCLAVGRDLTADERDEYLKGGASHPVCPQ
ncbi:hypothetical protein ABT147_33320 [Streptomyces sp. NPDC001868]|uniref:nSTAND1 domain-containing NTPase n=1 Tax=Streptomyces sp. NPDC001868 TaxID=3154401 RepID=UPI003318AABF